MDQLDWQCPEVETNLSALALALILGSAFIHASWNLMAKKALDGNSFIWLTSALILPMYAPLALYVLLTEKPVFGETQIVALLGTTFLHLVYFICLQAAYKIGDYSVVYPVARGTGPLLATTGAIYFLHEEPSILALVGIFLIVFGVVVISGGAKLLAPETPKKPIVYGLATGICIAAYTLWDKYAVADAGVSPVLLDYMATGGIGLLLLPYALSKKEQISREWRENRANVVGVSALSPISYLIVLYVLKSSPVYYVAPLREMSILIAAYLGAKLLKEGDILRRSVAATIMFCGVVALALG